MSNIWLDIREAIKAKDVPNHGVYRFGDVRCGGGMG